LKLLCLTDYRGASEMLTPLGMKIQEEQPDIILYCGGSMKGAARMDEYENARRFHSKPSMESPEIQAERLVDEDHLRQFMLFLADSQKTVYVIPGMSDAPESVYFKTVYSFTQIYNNFKPAHEQTHQDEAFQVTGFGGDINVGEDDREFLLRYNTPWAEFALRRLPYMPGEKVLMTYTPPVCRLDVSDGEHLGVLFVNEVVERVAPKLLVCGRATSGQGTVKMGPTTVVNPGPLFLGQYAMVDYPSLEVRCERLVDPSVLE